MTIRTFQPGDEEAQARIYNDAAGQLPKFKPANTEEVRRRCRAKDFDPRTRFYALADEQPVGYATFHPNGRVNYPWCVKGHEDKAEPLFQAVLQAMQQRKMPRAFAAYREDWLPQQEFFLAHGFRKVRDMVNFVLDMADMPTPGLRRNPGITPFRREDIPALAKLMSEALRSSSPADLENYYVRNPYFPAGDVYTVRDRSDDTLQAVGLVIANEEYANPKQVDSAMPCFRLGAFGTEGMQTKRINGMFSFICRGGEVNRLGLELLGHAVFRLRSTEVETFAAQAPSDAPHLMRFYQHHFRKQGSFPIFERAL
ncbi:MAG TPA: hypothetical protein VG099_19565 [Gemmataceae bacterium]|jgi:hypothetical protein|nr:hypothetical protein [Gemmataceae bacterium]